MTYFGSLITYASLNVISRPYHQTQIKSFRYDVLFILVSLFVYYYGDVHNDVDNDVLFILGMLSLYTLGNVHKRNFPLSGVLSNTNFFLLR